MDTSLMKRRLYSIKYSVPASRINKIQFYFCIFHALHVRIRIVSKMPFHISTVIDFD